MAKKRGKKPSSHHRKRSGAGGPKLKRVLRKAILTLMDDNPGKAYNYKQLAAAFDIQDTESRQLVITVLNELHKEGFIECPERGKYLMKPSRKEATGVIQISSRGSGFVTIEGRDKDVFVPPNQLNRALDGDTVEVRVYGRGSRGKGPDGEVVRVVERAREQYVGVVDIQKHKAYMQPDNQRIHVDFIIPLEDTLDARDGQKVIVEMTGWDDEEGFPIGRVTDVLGEPGNHEVEMHAILVEYGLPVRFPKNVEALAAEIPLELDQEEVKKRRDMRQTLTFTIDPVDAKDFDDALSFEKLENGHYRVGIHIADVSYYVTPGDQIDKEAYARATSVYLVDRVVPMLPEVLSNKVCSLRPHEEKFCFSAIFELDDSGQVYDEWFGRTVIYSDRRFTYEEAQEVIETGKGDAAEAILTLDGIAKKLRKKRMEAGALEIESAEIRFQIDEKGAPIGVMKKVMKDANKLIEEFMLLANRRVSEFIGKADGKKVVRPCVYRIHDAPAEEKLDTLIQFIATFGYKLSNVTPQNASSKINGLLKEIKGNPEEHTIRTMVIRSMAKAVYSTENIGHYGLAFDFYSHFTSPIRRYPDLMLHRILQDKLDNKPASNQADLEKKCLHSSNRERMAAEAERASIKYKQVEYLEKHIGDCFEAVIVSVVNWGFYVEITENFCEGLVSIHSLSDDQYTFDQRRFALVGRKYKKEFKIGDKVDVIVNRIDLLKKEVDLILAEEY